MVMAGAEAATMGVAAAAATAVAVAAKKHAAGRRGAGRRSGRTNFEVEVAAAAVMSSELVVLW